jgi:ferredoxin-type protein NapG
MPLTRRQVLQGAASATSACLIAGGAALLARPSEARPAQALRPPGALAEEHFLGACVRCGLCVRACPYDTLKLSDGTTGLARGVAVGTPYFEARKVACEMCEDIPCVKACPTGALDHSLTDINQAQMGTAVLVDEENCLNFLGLRCEACYRACPLIGKAITLDLRSNRRSDRHAMFLPTVHADACTGCGKCEKSCVLDQATIKVLPRQLARGALGAHYRKGWEPGPQQNRPRFEAPVQNLPSPPVPGDLVPLRSGDAPYVQPGVQAGRKDPRK